MSWVKVLCAIVFLLDCLYGSVEALATEAGERPKNEGLTNPFFAMDTGTKDANHQTAKAQVEMLKEIGYAGIGYGGLDGLSEMVEELDKNGLKLFSVYTGVWTEPGGGKYEPQLKQGIRSLKGRDTVIWLFIQSKEYGVSSPDGDPGAVEITREIADLARESGLKVALYPHAGFWLERVEDAVRVVKKAHRENLGVVFNLCHWLKVDSEASLKPLMKLALPYLYSVNINGADSGGSDWSELIQTLDRGSFDIYAFLKTLKELGYSGPIGLQGYGIKGDVHENLKRSMEAWRKLSGRIAADEDR